ncbi:hypothetical protein [Bradyrhizobium sp. STM 3561]|uniref:hypothetical protein n=1 Tax=Bradyrhizobium sp. STM 3561 TaxID=578923 RepID=UPI0038900034
MLAVYDADGRITQCIIQAQVSLEELAERYTNAGIPNVLFDSDDADGMHTFYVKAGDIVMRPRIAIDGVNLPIRANGTDALTFTLNPAAATVSVLFAGKLVHQEQVNDGVIEFSADHVGTYTVVIEPAFPYQTEILTIEVVA